MNYDYKEAVHDDVREFIEDHYSKEEIVENLAYKFSRDNWQEKLYDRLFCEDSVTGNASGSYTFNRYQAEENLCHNLDLLGEALSEFGSDPDYMSKNGAEACDVTIRCYLLSGAIDDVLDELEDEYEDDIDAYLNPPEEETEEEN